MAKTLATARVVSIEPLVLCPDVMAPRVARRWLAERLRASKVADSMVADALVIVSELVTNSVRHVNWQIYPGTITVHAYLSGGRLVIEVRDPSPVPPVPLANTETLREDGKGLPVVQSLALAFNYAILPNGKSVWAVCGDREHRHCE
jgi:anti-sigma regulatory factor (Ser/Thr protein kinase)